MSDLVLDLEPSRSRLRSKSFRLRSRTASNPVPFPLGNGVDGTTRADFGWNDLAGTKSWNGVGSGAVKQHDARTAHSRAGES